MTLSNKEQLVNLDACDESDLDNSEDNRPQIENRKSAKGDKRYKIYKRKN